MLSGFILRSLIPVGFMPMVGPDHSVRLVICDSYTPTPWIKTAQGGPVHADMGASHSHQSGDAMHPGGGPPVHQDHGFCPYGSSPALGALPSLVLSPIVVQRPQELAIALPQAGYFKLSPRAQSPRGPPAQTQDS
jgi:hypothetical protein